MRLAKPICDADGRVMAGAGSVLTASVLRILRRLAIQTVVVADGQDLAGWEMIRPLAEELTLLEQRMRSRAERSPRADLAAALERRLVRRAERHAAEISADGDSAAGYPDADAAVAASSPDVDAVVGAARESGE